MSNLTTNQLADLIDQKHACLMQLREVGIRQLEIARGGELEVLMQLLAGKQRLIDQLTRIEQQLKPYRGQDPEQREWSSAAARERCAAVATECEGLLRAIVQQEQQSTSELTRRRDDAEHRLQGAHIASTVHQAYVRDDAPQRTPMDYS
ncbi:MAG: hypothetical protein DWQ31_10930 [Planctomycetota bacterium]|nr:MAG: hypothetical protein DWQ31_10930 [Planctomycetota bacterium]REJ94395.1 MAG: hypothetical protein DWQ35_08330 [Planctomycetota bacterium]REK22072.1 MAG: hypothetical protein DWQ42_18195 [Planctomycetota bacterium]REK44480.1 MAG: hypothetical protein DWQ46_09480 [Planctomycetota bacterium]